MSSKSWSNGGVPESLVAFEYISEIKPQPYSLLFIGGLGDGLATTSYTADIVRALRPTQWSFFTLNFSSSYGQWGLGSLDRDTDEIAACVKRILEHKRTQFKHSKIVVMGHSTGSQAVLHYLNRPNPHSNGSSCDPDLQHVDRPAVDGAIMQAPVSDREAILSLLTDGFGDKSASDMQKVYDQLNKLATDVEVKSPEEPSEDDLFSSDLSDSYLSTTFGMIQPRGLLNGKLVVLYSGADQSVPASVDKNRLLRRWRAATDHEGQYQIWDGEFSGVILGASHALSDGDQAVPQKDVVDRVVGYLQRIELI